MKYTCLLLLSLLCFPALAGDDVIVDLWARATPPGSGSGAIYGRVINDTAGNLALEAVDVPGAGRVMIHETFEENGMMRMRHADVQLAPGQSLSLQPGGLHIMVMGLSERFVEGCAVTVRLTWDDGTISDHAVNVGGFGQQTAPAASSKACP